mmetsp:Transcript_76237/g.164954  ORF Transcript_76237/g.164954 Transcript_76237/m.164954 type:complete len:96 (-) Transcript_76237:12-299(-)
MVGCGETARTAVCTAAGAAASEALEASPGCAYAFPRWNTSGEATGTRPRIGELVKDLLEVRFSRCGVDGARVCVGDRGVADACWAYTAEEPVAGE